MVAEHTGSFIVEEDIHKVYDMALNYWQSMGFRNTSSQRPNNISFKRGSMWGIGAKKVPTELQVTFMPQPKGVFVSIRYVITYAVGFGAKDLSILNSEIEGLKTYILASIQQPMQTAISEKDRICVECKRTIPFDANICPYCGHDYRKV